MYAHFSAWMKARFRLLLIILLYTSFLSAQEGRAPRLAHHLVESLSFRLDTLSVIPGSFRFVGTAPSRWELDPIAATLYLYDSTLIGSTLSYEYQTYQMDFSKPLFHKDRSLIESATPYAISVPEYPSWSSDPSEDNSRLISSGSISRGVSVGNSQDLVLNSSLNLQLSGYVSDNIQIQAVISDKNIPIQPEGNTQNINNINNVYIKLMFQDKAQVCGGDIELPAPHSRFLFATGSLLGMEGLVRTSFKQDMTLVNRLGGGVAKGHFVQQAIQPQTGVQGPYKLTGEFGELGIVIIAGSERVYVDGKLLTRGLDNDYVIDYNTAELTFTPAMLMAAEKRVIVEFEYSDRHYSRYALYSYNDFQKGRHQLHVNFYQYQDLKSQSLQPELSDVQKLFLSQVGDHGTAVPYRSFEAVPFTHDRVLYARCDTVVDGQTFQGVFVYTADPSQTVYAPAFTYVGAHKGFYQLQSSTTNGRVFVWVAPVDGQPQGDYEAAVLLTTPKLAQMLTIASESQFTDRFSLENELALSYYDQNLFSKQDDKDNVGFSYHLAAKHLQPLQKNADKNSAWRLLSEVEWQFVHKYFHAIERFREVEFARDFNLSPQDSTPYSEQMLHVGLTVEKPSYSTTSYALNWFSQLQHLYALRHEVLSHQRWKGFRFDTRTTFLHSEDSIQHTRYWTSDNQLGYTFKQLEVGVRDLMEHNLFHDVATDTLRANSFAFHEVEAYLRNNPQQSKHLFQLSYKNRLEWSPDTADLQLHLVIHEAKAMYSMRQWENHQLTLKGTYRNQRLTSQAAPEHYFVGNLDYVGRFFKKSLLFQTYYELGSGMEQQKVFTFLKVAPGQGTHVWNDYNGNGIEELEEFELAAFQYEADYIKVFLSSNNYINTFNNQLTQTVQFRPANLWNKPAGFRKFLARFSEVAMFRSQQKDMRPMMNPFYTHLEDTNLISSNMLFNNTLSFNNSSSIFAFDYIYQRGQQKNLLYYGFERSSVRLHHLLVKSAPSKMLRLQTGYFFKITGNMSEAMSARCYEISQHQVEGKVVFQYRNAYTMTADYVWMQKREKTGSGAYMNEHKASLTADLRFARYGVLTSSVQYVFIRGDVEPNTSLHYVMLEGLSVGQNALWELRYQLSLNSYLQLALYYEGRFSQGHRVVHTGNVTVRAQF